MRVIDRGEQRAKASARYGQEAADTYNRGLSDSIFDGTSMPREISARNWLREGDVHDEQILSAAVPTTRALLGPQVSVTRDDMRRTTWAIDSDGRGLTLSNFIGPQIERNAGTRVERRSLAEGAVWRHSLTLDKYSGEARVAWVTRNSGAGQLWLDGEEVETSCENVDFPFLALSQAPVGHVQSVAPPFAILSYKCRTSGELFVRRIAEGRIEDEVRLAAVKTVGGAALAVHQDEVLVRVDLVKDGELAPALIRSSDGGRSFGKAVPIDLGAVTRGFAMVPGFAKPIVDKGGSFHVPIGLTSDSEALALNYIVRDQTLVEAIRVPGVNRKTSLEVFPSTVGSEASYGNGVSDGHGLIMVLSTEAGQLYSSNSSAGGIYFPEAAQLNHEMPRVAAFSASECYSSGLKANIVSMDYLFVEADDRGQPISPQLHIETWDMPLPVPVATAKAKGSSVLLTVEADCDLEPGKVMIHFDDPAVTVTDLDITGLRSAAIKTNSDDLKGKTIFFDVLTLFHKHHGQALIA